MTISTLIFDKAKIYKNKMIFTIYAKNGIYTKVLDNNGKILFNRISSKPIKEMHGDSITISRKISYEYPNNNITVKTLQRIYDLTGKLITTHKQSVFK